MGPAQAIRTCLAKSFQFSGRASRSEFWWFFAPFFGGAFVSFWAVELYLPRHIGLLLNPAFAVLLIYLTVLAAPFCAAAWRRSQDSGRPGAWALSPVFILAFGAAISLLERSLFDDSELPGLSGAMIGYGGFLLLAPPTLLLLALPSTPGPNSYGPNPLEVTK